MRIVEIGVTYRKQVSDGNYGTEAAEVHLSGTLETEDDAADQAEQLLSAAAEVAYERLGVSLSPAVRRAVELPRKSVGSDVAQRIAENVRSVEEADIPF